MRRNSLTEKNNLKHKAKKVTFVSKMLSKSEGGEVGVSSRKAERRVDSDGR